MPWNEPGNDKKDPWGNKKKGNDEQGPPQLDEVAKQLIGFLSKLMGKSGKNSNNNNSNSNGEKNPSIKAFFALIFILVIGVYLYSSIYIVDEKERAVILRFGKYVETVGPGLHMYFPPIEKRYQSVVTGYRMYRLTQEMLTKDENIVQVALSVQYNISDLKLYHLKTASPILSLQEATQSALRHVVGGSSMHEVLTEGREVLADEVMRRLQDYLDNYTTGLAVSRVNVESAQPPTQVQASFDDVIRAREDEERSKNTAYAYANQLVPEARGKAERLIQAANAYSIEVVELAEGQTSFFNSILNVHNLSPEVMEKRMYYDTMQQVLTKSNKIFVDNNTSGNVFYIPLDKMLNKSDAKSTTLQNNDSLTAKQQGLFAEKIIKNADKSKASVGR